MVQRSRAQRLNGLFPLSYTGVVPVSPVNFVMDDRAPTINDSKNFYIGDMWLDISTQPPSTRNLWVLTSLVGNNATWDNFGSGDLETLTGNSGGPVFPDGANNINVVGDGTSINVVGNPVTNTLTISAIAGTALVETLTGNSGGAVSPLAGNINVVGTGVITVAGNPGTHTLTVTPSGSIASSFITSPATGTAIPVAGVLTFAGTGGIDVSAAGSTVTITASGITATQCAFGAYKSVDSNNVTGDGTFYQVICDGELYDLSNNYNNATGVFTAPDNGTYHFDTYIAAHNISDQTLSAINIETTNAIFHSDLQSPVNDKQADNILHYQLSVDVNMNAGDTALIKIALGGGSAAKTVGVTGAIPPGSPIATYFSGHRLDPAASFITGTQTFHTQDGNNVTANLSGLVNVSGAGNISTTGTVGPNTLTIHYVPTSSFTATFNTETNITGDGTVALLGATAAATVLTNVGGNFFPGSGVGAGCSYTVPVTGLYCFFMYTDFSVGASATDGIDFSLGLSGGVGFNLSKGPTKNSCTGYANNSGEINVGGSCVIQVTSGTVINFSVQSNGAGKNLTINTGAVGGYRIS